jgi:hypothetical protein
MGFGYTQSDPTLRASPSLLSFLRKHFRCNHLDAVFV